MLFYNTYKSLKMEGVPPTQVKISCLDMHLISALTVTQKAKEKL